MASLLVSALSPFAGNVVVQSLLKKGVSFSESLMGIGTCAGVWGSAKQAILKSLQKYGEPPYCLFDVGVQRTLAKQAIDLGSFGFGGTHIDTRSLFREFWFLLSDCGMNMFRIMPSGNLSRIRKYKEIHEQYRTTNFIAIRNKNK